MSTYVSVSGLAPLFTAAPKIRPMHCAAPAALLRRLAGCRRLHEGTHDEPLTEPETSGSDDESSSSLVLIIVLLLILLAVCVAWRMWRLRRFWANHARSVKVLDEIEMEFVNDDADDHVLEDEDIKPRRSDLRR